MTHSSCPARCDSPICERNVDPVGEERIRAQSSHYGPVYCIELLLHNAGILDSASDRVARSDVVRRVDVHRGLDVVLVESKIARRDGKRSDLGRYDPRFAGIEITWIPVATEGRDGPRSVAGAPHLIDIRVNRPPVDAGAPVSEISRPVKQLKECLWTSGQQFNTLNPD